MCIVFVYTCIPIHNAPDRTTNQKGRPTEKPYTLSDGLGLSLLVEPNGSKAWRFRYRFDGKPKMLSLGTYEHISLADARQRRDESRRLVASGVNPSTLRKEQKAAKTLSATNTFEAITRQWYEHRYDRWPASYRTEVVNHNSMVLVRF